MQGRSVFAIAHRLSTSARRQILVLTRPHRRARTHEVLLGKSGIYRRLHGVQFDQPPRRSNHENERTRLVEALCTIPIPPSCAGPSASSSRRGVRSAPEAWTILRLLRAQVPQREIARRIGGSLCNVTRGARLLHRKNCASARLMDRLDAGLDRNNG
jgi:hypothetical protein